MDRFFLALIVSGLLLAAASVSLLVVTGGSRTTVSVMDLPSAPIMPGHKVGPRPEEAARTMPPDGAGR